jgi:hypothetical protein
MDTLSRLHLAGAGSERVEGGITSIRRRELSGSCSQEYAQLFAAFTKMMLLLFVKGVGVGLSGFQTAGKTVMSHSGLEDRLL